MTEDFRSIILMCIGVLSHELKKMEKEGILKVRKNHFELADKE